MRAVLKTMAFKCEILNQLIDYVLELQTFHLRAQAATSENTLLSFLILYTKIHSSETEFHTEVSENLTLFW